MRIIYNIEDRMRGYITYEVGEDRYVRLDARNVQRYGLEALLRDAGYAIPTGRVPVFQSGKKVGTVPALFDPTSARSESFFYDIRPGDFVHANEGWAADKSLGPGDLSAIPGFQWDDDPLRAERDKEQDRDTLKMALGLSLATIRSPKI